MDEAVDVDMLHAHLRGEHSVERAEGCPACHRLPAVPVPGPRPAPQNTGSPSTGRLCGCGCGSAVARRFLPGHDAKLKSRLVREARDGSTAALEELHRYGWAHFV